MVPPERAGIRADAFLFAALPFLSRTRIKQKIQTGESLLNGRRYATSARLKAGDEITVLWRATPEIRPSPALRVVYEDDRIVAVDKPAGMFSHPSGKTQSGTLIQALKELCHGKEGVYPCLVNRLDRFTSGIVLAAKDREALTSMHALAARGGISKRYVAVVEGDVAPPKGRIDAPIGRDTWSGIGVKMAVRTDGLPSVTEYEALRGLDGGTLLYAFPLTGRQHQIRVHFASIGHPVRGDLLYGEDDLRERYWGNGCVLDASMPPRHLLHAESVSFSHPLTAQTVEIASALPDDFIAALGI